MADNQFKISLGVSVDTSSISESIKKYNNRKNKSKIKVGVSLDSVGISKQIKAIAPKTPMTIKVRLDDTQALNQIKNIRTQLQQLGNISVSAGSVNSGRGVSGAKSGISSTVNEVNKSYNDLMNLAKRINSIRFKIGGLDATKNSGQISELSNQLNRLMSDYNNLYNTFTKGLNMSQLDAFKNKINSVEAELNQLKATEEMFSKQGIDVTRTRANIESLENQLRELRAAYASFSNGLTIGQIDSLTNVFQNTTNAVAALNAKISDTRANFAKGIVGNIGGYDNQIISLENRLAALADEPVKIRTGIESVKTALNSLRNANGVDDIITKYKAFENVLKQVDAQLKAQELREKKAYTEQSFQAAKDSALKKLNSLFTEGSAAAKKYSGEVERLRNELNKCGNIQGIRNVNRQITALQAEIKNTRIQTQSFSERIKTQFAKYSSYFSVASVFMYGMQGLKDMFNQVVAIDSAMTELKKVTDETNESYNKFLKNAASRSKEIGTTIDGLVASTADFARLGYSFEDSQGLAEVANIYTVVGDEIDDVETATKSLISTLAAFKDEAGDLSNAEFAMEIVDKFNEVSNNFAISSGGIGDALQRSASSMYAANNTLDETIALITAANTVVQNPTRVGNAFKTVSMRIRGAKTELEEAGESTEGMAESTAALRKEILALSGVDIMLNENTFKSTYQILDELSTKWEGLSDIAQASITELIAGKHQGNVIASTMSNFDIAREALETSLNSSGSAMKEHEKWQQSLEARINKLKASWQSLAQSFMSSDFLRSALDAVIAFVDGLTKLIDTVGVLPTLLGVFAGGRAFFGGNSIFTFDKDAKSVRIFGDSIDGLNDKYVAVQKQIIRYNAASSKSASFQEKYNNALQKSNSSFAQYARGLNGSKATMKGYIASLVAGKAATIGLQVATIALNAALTMGISALISWGISKLDEWIETSDELADRIGEITSKYKEQKSELVKNKPSFDYYVKRYDELSKGIDSIGENVSLTTAEYEEYKNVVNSIAEQVPTMVSGYNSQGDAILNCAGNVDVLSGAYRNLIREQNSLVLDNGEDYFKDFKNNYTFSTEVKAENINMLKSLSKMSGNERKVILSNKDYAKRVSDFLNANGVERDVLGNGDWGFESYSEHVERAISEEQEKIKNVLDEASSNIESYADNLGAVTEAYFSQAFLGKYSNMSDEMQGIITKFTSGLGSDFYAKFKDDENAYESLTEYYDSILNTFEKLDDIESSNFEIAFNLKTQFNNGEISYGEYINSLQNAGDFIDKMEFSDNAEIDKEVKSQIKLSLGLNESGAIEEYQTLLNRLTSEDYKIQLDEDSAKSFLGELSSEELSITIGFVEDGNENFYNAIENYKSLLDEAKEAGVDFSRTTYGNIDTSARQVLEWNSENLEKYKEQLMSFEADDASWDNVKDSYEDTISTVMGVWDTFEIDGKKIDIAFSPMLQTDNGAEILSSDTVNGYIDKLIEKATEDGKWDEAELMKLDADGIEVDGKKIRAILADIGDTAEATSMQMHFVGKDGAIALAKDFISSIVEEQARISEALNFSTNIEVDKTSLEAFNTALEESSSAMGLTSASIGELESRYSDLDDYDAAELFEKTANGVKVNRTELNKLEKKHRDLKKTKVQEHLDTLVDEYNKLTSEIDSCNSVSERAEILAKRNGYKSRIEELAQYQAQLEGVTGAYQRWLDAQNAPEDYEGYQAIASGYKDVKEELSRGMMGNASKEYIDLISGKDLQGANIDEYFDAWQDAINNKVGKAKKYSITDFFTVDDSGNATDVGVDRFFESIRDTYEGTIYDANTKTYDFSKENLQKIQDEWGIGTESIQKILEAAIPAGYDVDFGGIVEGLELDVSDYDTFISCAEAVQKMYNSIESLDDVDFDFDATDIKSITSDIDKAREKYNELIADTDGDGKLNFDAKGAEEMRFMIEALIIQKQQLSSPAIISVDTSQIDQAKSDVISVIDKTKELQTAYENYEIAISTGVDVEDAQKDLKEAISGLEETSASIRADLKLPTDAELEQALGELGDIKVGATLDDTTVGALETKIQTECTPEVIAKVTGLDETAIQSGKGARSIKYTPEHSEVDAYINGLTDINKLIIFTYDVRGKEPDPKNIRRKITYTYETEGQSPAIGTAHAVGTAGHAFAHGDWSIGGNGTALGGELGQELVVRDGRFFTVGDNGAEFFKYKKNDIVFNAAQTESLFKYGGIKGAKPRGKMLASGSAFADGSLNGRSLASGSSSITKLFNKIVDKAVNNYYQKNIDTTNNTTKKTSANSSNFAKSDASERAEIAAAKVAYEAEVRAREFAEQNGKTTGKTGSGGGGGGSSSDAADEFEEVIDWIEVKIDRIERAIDQLDQKANSVYRSWTERNTALVDQIGKVREEINIQQQAYDRYIQQANSVGLDEAYASKVRDGTIDIETITDEELKKKIDDYKQWYEKALDCKDAVEELKETEAELYAQRVEHAASQYEGILGVIEHEKSMLEEYINQSEAQAWIVSKEYYDALANNERENIAELQNQKAAMLAEFNAAMNSGTIAEGSEAYYEMVSSIDEVTMSITESQTTLLEYEQTIQQLSWETFDMLQEKISSVVEETEFLIDLMSNDKLHDDTGKLTGEGKATMGLHGVAYNTYMAQADQAAAEAARLKKELEADPFDTELEGRYREMVALQQEYILSAEDEKDAIRDLVEEGINLEIEALEERIDKYNEALESQKDLYDYQKKVAESTKEIASLEKQMAAYAGDDSEEARQKIQQIKVDLESARADLEETEYDKYISDTEKMLDDLSLKYEELLNMRLDNIDALIADMIQEINSDAGVIGETIREATDSVGYTLSESMNTIWDKSTVDTKNVITTYGEKFSTAQTTTNNALNTINNNLQNIINKLNGKAQTSVSTATTSSVAKSYSSASAAANTSANNASGGNGTPKIGDKVKFVSGQYYYDSEGKNPIGSKNQGKEVYITNINNRANATHPYHISTGKKLGDGDLGWLKLNQISGYATGKKNFFDDEIAWTQEDGTEFIVRPSDGAILTPIARGDKVLNAKASGNIWQMANSPAEFIRDNLNLGVSDVPNGSNVQNSYTQYLDKVVFNLPEVKNYEELLYAFQKDKNFERLIHAMTIDRVAGKSSLAKGKSIR